jgi:hypothetical protein
MFDEVHITNLETEEQLKAREAGKALHRVAELYHKHGQAPDEATLSGRAFMPALQYLPPPGAGRAEGEFSAFISGVEYKGFIDLEYDVGANSVILDYKSKGSIRTGAGRSILQGEGDFYNDPQVLVYTTKVFASIPETEDVLARWLYIKRLDKITDRPKAVLSECLMGRTRTIDSFGRIVHPVAKVITHLRQYPVDPLTLPPNPDTCLKYGEKYACPHISRCNLTISDRLYQYQENEHMDLLASLRAKENTNPTQATPKPETPTLTPTVPKGVNPPTSGSVAVDTVRALPPTVAGKHALAEQSIAVIDSVSDAALGAALRTLLKAYKAI